MDKLQDITEKLRDPAQPRDPLNKFRVSECYDIVNGYKSMKEFVYGKECDPIWRYVMDSGTKKHEMIEKYLEKDYTMEQKGKKEFGEIVLSGTADMIGGDEILDLKTSFNILEGKEKYLYQVRMYLSLFDKQKGRIVQPVIKGLNYKNPKGFRVYLKTIGETTRDDRWFSEQILLLTEYYHKVIKKYGKVQQEKIR